MIVDCKAIADDIISATREVLKDKITPTLAIVSCGTNEASKVYIRNKIKKCAELGINCVHYPTDEFEVCREKIRDLNDDPSVTAIMLQLPTKYHSNYNDILINTIHPDKDVDGLTNQSKFFQVLHGSDLPCTSMAVLEIIDRCIDGYGECGLPNMTVGLYGRSDLVNKPLVHELIELDATVTMYHSKSPIGATLCDHDISVVAVGKPRHFKINDTGKKQLIIDVGINRDENGKLCGDVDTRGFEDNPNILYTPVPNGVGVLTCANLCYKVALMCE